MSPFRGRGDTPWPGLFDGLPERYNSARDADGFVAEEITFCLWYDDGWQIGAVEFPCDAAAPDGSAGLLTLLDDDPSSYAGWARDYYERELDLTAVASIYAGTPLTADLVAALNPGTSMSVARRAATEVGYGPSPRSPSPRSSLASWSFCTIDASYPIRDRFRGPLGAHRICCRPL